MGAALPVDERFDHRRRIVRGAAILDRVESCEIRCFIRDMDAQGAELSVGSERFGDCRENRLRSVWEHAKLSGASFRATGEDPAWYLEIRDGDRLEFRSALDAAPLRLPMSEVRLEAGAAGASYRSAGIGSEFVAGISATPCTVDDGLGLSGVTVVVTEGGRRFSGCGRPLH